MCFGSFSRALAVNSVSGVHLFTSSSGLTFHRQFTPHRPRNVQPAKGSALGAVCFQATEGQAFSYRKKGMGFWTCATILRTRSTVRQCPMTVGQNAQLLWQQTDFDFIVGQCRVSDENSACSIYIRHNTLPDGDVKVRMSYDSATKHAVWWCRESLYVVRHFHKTLCTMVTSKSVL